MRPRALPPRLPPGLAVAIDGEDLGEDAGDPGLERLVPPRPGRDAHLADRQFIVGERLTLADFDIAGPFSQNERTTIPLNEVPNFVAWQQRLLKAAPSRVAMKREVDARIDRALGAAGIAL